MSYIKTMGTFVASFICLIQSVLCAILRPRSYRQEELISLMFGPLPSDAKQSKHRDVRNRSDNLTIDDSDAPKIQRLSK